MKRMDIEALLRWAYRDELPKAAASGGDRLAFGFRTGWGGVERYGELLAVVQEPDVRNRYGLIPDGSDGDPCADAIAVAAAVERLGRCDFDLPEGWDPLSDMGGAAAFGAEGLAAVVRGIGALTVVDATGRTVLRRSPARLVIRHAILGGCPDWEGEVPERRVEMVFGRPRWYRRVTLTSDGAFGQSQYEVEVDGFDYRRRRPHPDAYQRHYFEPDLAALVTARAEYEIWRAALDLVAEDVGGGLVHHMVEPSAAAARPWEASAEVKRILPSLRVAREAAI
ncbi:hypothetical protein [Xanthobacter sediminis]